MLNWEYWHIPHLLSSEEIKGKFNKDCQTIVVQTVKCNCGSVTRIWHKLQTMISITIKILVTDAYMYMPSAYKKFKKNK